MEKVQHLSKSCRKAKLDGEQFEYWNVSIRQLIQTIDMNAWIAVEECWVQPMVKDTLGKTVLKPRNEWLHRKRQKLSITHKHYQISANESVR